MTQDYSKVLAFSNEDDDAYFVDAKVRFTLTPIALLYYQELARRAVHLDGLYFLDHVRSLEPREASDEYTANMPWMYGTLRTADGAQVLALYDHMIHFALLRESLDGLVGPYLSVLVGLAMNGDVLRVRLGLEIWHALAKRRVTISGPADPLVMDAAHGEYHFKTTAEIDRLVSDLPVIADIKRRQMRMKEQLPQLPSEGSLPGVAGTVATLGLPDDDIWANWSLSDFENSVYGVPGIGGTGPRHIGDGDDSGGNPLGQFAGELGNRPGSGKIDPGMKPGDFPSAGGRHGPLGDLVYVPHIQAEGSSAPPTTTSGAGGTSSTTTTKTTTTSTTTTTTTTTSGGSQGQQGQQDQQGQVVACIKAEVTAAVTKGVEGGAKVGAVLGGLSGVMAGPTGVLVGAAAGAVLGADAGVALGYLWGGVGGGYVCIMTGGQHMDDPNNPTVPKNDPILGLWYQTKTIVGRAWKNHIARRGGCYWAPRCADLVGRKAFWDLTSLRQANPATDVRWGTESQARPSANVDWVEVARELRKKYEWLADTAQRLEKAQRNAK